MTVPQLEVVVKGRLSHCKATKLSPNDTLYALDIEGDEVVDQFTGAYYIQACVEHNNREITWVVA